MAKRKRNSARFNRRAWLRAVDAADIPPGAKRLARYLAAQADDHGHVVIVDDTRAEP
jgi:hypothetical protein